jgi:tetratricopeptide (TPR) repeat protein
MAAQKKILGPDHHDTLTSLNNLGVAYEKLKRYAEAEACYREAWEGRVRVLDHEHPFTPLARDGLVYVLRAQNKFEEVTKFLEEAAKVMENAIEASKRVSASPNVV